MKLKIKPIKIKMYNKNENNLKYNMLIKNSDKNNNFKFSNQKNQQTKKEENQIPESEEDFILFFTDKNNLNIDQNKIEIHNKDDPKIFDSQNNIYFQQNLNYDKVSEKNKFKFNNLNKYNQYI